MLSRKSDPTKRGADLRGLSEPNTAVDDAYNSEADYGATIYWDERYSRFTEAFEWYYGYRQFRAVINEHVKREVRVLVAGCGSSTMCEDLADDEYSNVVGADISRVVIDQQTTLAVEYPEIEYIQCNMCSSFLSAGSFGAIIDKGLYDAIGCSIHGQRQVLLYVREVLRLLDTTGVFVLVSYQLPEAVLVFLENHDLKDAEFTPWNVSVSEIPKPAAFEGEELDLNDLATSVYFIYVCVMDPELMHRQDYRNEKMNKRKKDRLGKRDWKQAPVL
jgi:SAM-dependent methyltransferase